MSSTPPIPVRLLRGMLRPLKLETTGRAWWHRWKHRAVRRLMAQSETSKCRDRLAPWCTGYGLDLGFGGDPIVAHAIRVDLPQPYTGVGKLPVQLGGDATRLHWLADDVLDFVFSSHLLEDFVDTGRVLAEWMRVLKPGGRLIIFCPDEQIYRRHCAATGQPYNQQHVHAEFSLAFVKQALSRTGIPHRVLHERPLVDGYSWEIVAVKLAS